MGAATQVQSAQPDALIPRTAGTDAETERALEQLRLLYNISTAISSSALDIHQTLEVIAENLAALPAIERCVIWLTTSEITLQVGAIAGTDETGIGRVTLPLDPSASFVTRALLTRSGQRLDSADDALAPFLAGRGGMAVPMWNEDRPVGVVMINGRSQELPLDSFATNLIQAAADQAAVALENAQLYTRVIRFNQELEAKVQQRTAELEQANAELERVNRDLERLDRTKSDFISIAAHELKTPLTLIQGYANIMREDRTVKGNSFLLDVLDGIVKGGARLYSIIESMIDVSMIDGQVLQLRLAPTSLRNLVETVRENYHRDLSERSLTLRLGDFDGVPLIEADPQRLYQVFDNLIVNAIKYTPDGGWIAVDGWMMDSGPEQGWVETVVSDSGIGIDAEHHEHIFEKFYQTGQVALHSSGKTKFKGGGPGLGLAIAKGIVEAHGGRIWVESERYDERRCPGSEFHVVMPVKSTIVTPPSMSPFSSSRSGDWPG